MPDFNQLAQQLHADVSNLNWPDPGRIRAVGNRRRRAKVVAAASAAAVAIAAVLLLPHAGPRQGSTPASSPPPTAVSPTPTTTPANNAAIPLSALLTTADFGSTFNAGSPFPAMDHPNPFLGCGPDGLPGAAPPVASLGMGFGEGQGGSQAGDSVLRFATGAAHQTMAATSDLMAGACAGHYQVLSRNLGGDESLLLHSADLAMVEPQAAHGTAIYYAIVRKGDYLMWVTLINQTQKAGQTTLATTLAHRAEQRLCAAVAC